MPASNQEQGHILFSIEHSNQLLTVVFELITNRGKRSEKFANMDVQLTHGLKAQSLATIVFGGVRLATKSFLDSRKYIMIAIDTTLRSNMMSLSSLFPSAFPVPRPTIGSRLQYLVCLSLLLRCSGAIDPSANIHRGQTHVQTRIFVLTRSPRFHHDPLRYRPQRWLPPPPQAIRCCTTGRSEN